MDQPSILGLTCLLVRLNPSIKDHHNQQIHVNKDKEKTTVAKLFIYVNFISDNRFVNVQHLVWILCNAMLQVVRG